MQGVQLTQLYCYNCMCHILFEHFSYVILTHRWINPTEVDYEEMIDLAKMDRMESTGPWAIRRS